MVELTVNEKPYNVVEKKRTDREVVLEVDGTEIQLETIPVPGADGSTILLRVGSRVLTSRRALSSDGKTVEAWVNDRPLRVGLVNRQAVLSSSRAKAILSNGPVIVEAPMAGRIVEVKATLGGEVKEGQSLLVLEAMKMENEIAAPRDGRIRDVHVKVGSLVRPGDKLVVLE